MKNPAQTGSNSSEGAPVFIFKCGSRKIRSMKIYNKDDFTDKLNNANWSDLYLCRNVNYAWRIFQEIFMSILDDIKSNVSNLELFL
jgi:hypothetical protein